MTHLILVCLTVFIVTVCFIYFIRPLAIRIGLVDSPNERKLHEGNIPKVGGLAMFAGFLVGIFLLNIPLLDYDFLLISLCILVFFGVLDDFHELTARRKFLVQILVATIVVVLGRVCLVYLGNILFIKEIGIFGKFNIPITIVAIVAGINAVNMLDGVDGLIGSITLIQFVFLAVLSLLARDYVDFGIIMVVISVIIGFLFFNYPLVSQKYKVFAGDAGTMFLGLLTVWFLISLSQSPRQVAKPIVFLWVFALPMFDLMSVIYRRLRQGKSPFVADREHFHHVFQNAGLSDRQVVWVASVLGIVFGLFGTVGTMLSISEGSLFVCYLLMFCLYLYCFNHMGWLGKKSSASNSLREE